MNRFGCLILVFFCFPALSLFSQSSDIKELSDNDIYRNKQLIETDASLYNKTWEGVSLSLLVPDIEKAAQDEGLESFSISIKDNTINIIYRDIRFQPNSYEVTPETVSKLQKLSKVLGRFFDLGLRIEGHTAKLSKDDTDDGMELSENRAKSVASIIAETGIFASDKIQAIGKGYYEPIQEGYSSETKALNRRVEMSIGGSPDTDSSSEESISETRWWDFLSESMNPGYSSFFVPGKSVDDVSAALVAAGLEGLILAPVNGGVGILDDTLAFKMNDAPNSRSIAHIETIGNVLTSLAPDTQVRIGGYHSEISDERISERHFLAAYTMATTGGFSPDKILFGKEDYILTEASTALKSKSLSKTDGTIIETEDKDTVFSAVVPYDIDSIMIEAEATDPLAKISGISEEPVELEVGKNDIEIMVETAGSTLEISQKYTFSIVRRPIPGTTLKNLSIYDEQENLLNLTPPFSPDITDYLVQLPYSVKSVVVNAQKEDTSALLEKPDKPVSLMLGKNEILTTVSTPTRSASTEYKLVVERNIPVLDVFSLSSFEKEIETETYDLNFDPEMKIYEMTVPNGIKNVKLNAVLREEDKSAGAALEVLSPDLIELEIGSNPLELCITDAEGNKYDYKVIVIREKLFNFSIAPEWVAVGSGSVFTNGAGGNVNGGVNFIFTDESGEKPVENPFQIGVGVYGQLAKGNYMTPLTAGGYLRVGYSLSTDDWFEHHWFLPTAFTPRVDLGASYVDITYEGEMQSDVHEAAFYCAPGIRTDFQLRKVSNMKLGIDVSYPMNFGTVSISNLNVGLSIAW